jgi:predicted RNA-binding protein associated with RNAse of E/G family
MSKKSEDRYEPDQKLHLRYVRLPDKVLDEYDEPVYRSELVIVGKSQIVSEHSVTFNHEVVLAKGFQIIYFELMRKWFSVGKIVDPLGRHTGYYCDIVKPPRLLEDGGVEVTDLFLDLWVSPDLKYKVLDEEELENAFDRGWITKQLYGKAKDELKRLINTVERKRFPPLLVRHVEKKLHL